MSERVEAVSTEAASVEVGSIVEGKVVRIKPFGAIVSLPNSAQGLVHISHISTSFVQNIEEHLAIGDVVKVKIMSADEATGKISLSIKEAMAPQRRSDYDRGDRDNHRPRFQQDSEITFEDKFKDFVKASNERQAGLSKRNKRR